MYPLSRCLTYQRLSPSYTAFLTTIFDVHQQKTFHEAQSQAIWKQAMEEELAALVENNTWEYSASSKWKTCCWKSMDIQNQVQF